MSGAVPNLMAPAPNSEGSGIGFENSELIWNPDSHLGTPGEPSEPRFVVHQRWRAPGSELQMQSEESASGYASSSSSSSSQPHFPMPCYPREQAEEQQQDTRLQAQTSRVDHRRNGSRQNRRNSSHSSSNSNGSRRSSNSNSSNNRTSSRDNNRNGSNPHISSWELDPAPRTEGGLSAQHVPPIEPLSVVALGVQPVVRPQALMLLEPHAPPACGRGLWARIVHMLRKAICPLPWLLCLLGLQLGAASGIFSSPDVHWQAEEMRDIHWSLGILLCAVAAAASLREKYISGSRVDLGPPLATIALLVWQFGLHRLPVSPSTSSSSLKWCAAVTKSVGQNNFPAASGRVQEAAFGLLLVDDVLRAILRFASSSPKEAFQIGATNKRVYSIWAQDEEWWRACYEGVSWMRLPTRQADGRSEGSRMRESPSASQLLREAALWISMAAQTLGTVILLRPKCASPAWALTPCMASTMMMISCGSFLPRQSDVILVETIRLLRSLGRFALYFQAVWLVVAGCLLTTDEMEYCAWSQASRGPLLVLELSAVVVLHILIASRLWAAAAKCRATSPLYAVSAGDFLEGNSVRSQPLYCSTLGLVEGSYAPTAMCDVEELESNNRLTWRDRFAIRRCTEELTVREAHLLSYLDAVQVRLDEAEEELRGVPEGRSGASNASNNRGEEEEGGRSSNDNRSNNSNSNSSNNSNSSSIGRSSNTGQLEPPAEVGNATGEQSNTTSDYSSRPGSNNSGNNNNNNNNNSNSSNSSRAHRPVPWPQQQQQGDASESPLARRDDLTMQVHIGRGWALPLLASLPVLLFLGQRMLQILVLGTDRLSPRLVLEWILWIALLLRVAHGGLQILRQSFLACRSIRRDVYLEVLTLRQHLCTVHRSLAEVQWLIQGVEERLAALSVLPADSFSSGSRNVFAAFNNSATTDSSLFGSSVSAAAAAAAYVAARLLRRHSTSAAAAREGSMQSRSGNLGQKGGCSAEAGSYSGSGSSSSGSTAASDSGSTRTSVTTTAASARQQPQPFLGELALDVGGGGSSVRMPPPPMSARNDAFRSSVRALGVIWFISAVVPMLVPHE